MNGLFLSSVLLGTFIGLLNCGLQNDELGSEPDSEEQEGKSDKASPLKLSITLRGNSLMAKISVANGYAKPIYINGCNPIILLKKEGSTWKDVTPEETCSSEHVDHILPPICEAFLPVGNDDYVAGTCKKSADGQNPPEVCCEAGRLAITRRINNLSAGFYKTRLDYRSDCESQVTRLDQCLSEQLATQIESGQFEIKAISFCDQLEQNNVPLPSIGTKEFEEAKKCCEGSDTNSMDQQPSFCQAL